MFSAPQVGACEALKEAFVAVHFEGLTADEVLALPDSDLDALVLTGEPLVLRIGSARVLGQFRVQDARLVLELAVVEGGGEGILTALASLADRCARKRDLDAVEWIVHAVHCAEPNLKLRRVLERRGFVVRDVPRTGGSAEAADGGEEEAAPYRVPWAGGAENPAGSRVGEAYHQVCPVRAPEEAN